MLIDVYDQTSIYMTVARADLRSAAAPVHWQKPRDSVCKYHGMMKPGTPTRSPLRQRQSLVACARQL